MLTIVGSGKVGGDAALFSALKEWTGKYCCWMSSRGCHRAKRWTLNHMLSERGVDVEVRGSNDYSDMAGSDVVVVVAGSGRKPGMTRMDLLKINAGIVASVAENIKKYAPDSIIVPVTNPLDPMAYAVYKVSGFARERIVAWATCWISPGLSSSSTRRWAALGTPSGRCHRRARREDAAPSAVQLCLGDAAVDTALRGCHG